ncbi:MAG: DNA polymerase III subunit [Pirellulaceae bacterium]
MQWSDLIGHQQQFEWFNTAIASNRLASSFLFVGPDGIGKRTFARLLAKSLLCQHGGGESMRPCGVCEDCAQVDARTHPDLVEVAKPADKAFIPIELLIGEREKRMREGLCHDISLRPFSGRRKVAILDDADALNTEGANSLLKTLEEPPPDSLLILIGTSLQRQLPTIRSRCQAIIFRPLSADQMTTLLMRSQTVAGEEDALRLAMISGGSLTEARLLADPDLINFRGSMLGYLAASKIPMAEFTKSCSGMIDAVGKDGKLRRERMKLLLRMAAAFYRGLAIRQHAGAGTSSQEVSQFTLQDDPELTRAIGRAIQHWKYGAQAATRCWLRCLTAIEEVDRNANQAALLECLAADLAQASGC